MRRIRSADLAVFLAIAEHRSFRKAAVELGVTASALSHSLRAIEERLDVRLVNRTTRGVGLTEAGERLLERIRPAFLDIDAALDELDTFRGQPMGKLRLNAPRAAAKLVLLPIFGAMNSLIFAHVRADARNLSTGEMIAVNSIMRATISLSWVLVPGIVGVFLVNSGNMLMAFLFSGIRALV